jgi:hypothetical protein
MCNIKSVIANESIRLFENETAETTPLRHVFQYNKVKEDRKIIFAFEEFWLFIVIDLRTSDPASTLIEEPG